MSTTRFIRPSKIRVRAPRVPIDLEVRSKTIGTSASYSLMTEDISRSGLLLVWEREQRMPFLVNTIIEMTIDPDGSCLDKPINCLGKVVRRDQEEGCNDEMTRLGVQIVQIDNTDLVTWESCLTQLERRFGIEVSNKIISA